MKLMPERIVNRIRGNSVEIHFIGRQGGGRCSGNWEKCH